MAKAMVAIAGIGNTEWSHDSGRSELMLSLEAILAACADAGIEPREVDGLMRWSVDTTHPFEIASNLGINELHYFGEVSEAGNVGAALLAHASAAIEAGLAETVVIYRGMNGRSGRRYGRGEVTGRGARGTAAFSEPFGILTPQHGLAMKARRRMHEFGTTSLHSAHVAATIRYHANRNPAAFFHAKPLTVEQHQESRLVVEPFHLFDCCLETDGAGAFVVVSAERARDLRQRPAYVLAAVQGGPAGAADYVDTSAVVTGRRLFAKAGVTPGDVDVVQIYDHFAPFVIFALEDYGFVARGEGGPFVASGGMRWGEGRLPVNTSGGQLSEAYLQGMNLVLEAVRQARGTSTSQVEGARLSFVDTGIGSGAAMLSPEPSS